MWGGWRLGYFVGGNSKNGYLRFILVKVRRINLLYKHVRVVKIEPHLIALQLYGLKGHYISIDSKFCVL